jgi:structural maintenance of chromosome 2
MTRFDPHFNAITGLNGSGKSNILDSICFVLGITNLSQVRAGNLSELVYKQGQAGVNKATVTIVFNNSDPSTSPVGYEQVDQVTVTRQVLLGGKSKYLINGKNAPAGQVQNLFHSVQLNVNNPHFLIMQGRITKVLNMKPNEILGMVEEAAGTRMYETKRVAALKTMEKKQLKLNELQTILEEEITPTLERLRGEKQSYLTWSKNNADVERLQRFVTAAEYAKAVAACESDGMSELEGQISDLETRSNDIKSMMEAKDAEINERSSMLQGAFADTLRAAKELEKYRSKELVKVSSAWKSRKDAVQKAESDLEAARKLVQDSKAAIEAKRTEVKEESDKISEMLEEARVAKERLAHLTEDYQNMSAGISSSQGDEGRTLPDQISKALSDSKTAQAKIEQAKLRIAHLTKEVKVCIRLNRRLCALCKRFLVSCSPASHLSFASKVGRK